MADIHGVEMSDEQFMLGLELGRILQSIGYDGEGEIDRSKITDKRALEILDKLEKLNKVEA